MSISNNRTSLGGKNTFPAKHQELSDLLKHDVLKHDVLKHEESIKNQHEESAANGLPIINDELRVTGTELFDTGAVTLLFHEVGLHGYYGNIMMYFINALMKEEFKPQYMDIINIIKSCLDKSYEELRCTLYEQGLVCPIKKVDKDAIKNFRRDPTNKKYIQTIYELCPDECILYVLLLALKSSNSFMYMPLLLVMKVFTRCKPVNPTAWMDNFSLNNLGFALSVSERISNYGNKEPNEIYTVGHHFDEKYKEPKIIESNDINIDQTIKFIFNPVQLAIAIERNDFLNSITATDAYKSVPRNEIADKIRQLFVPGNNDWKKQILDEAAKIFPNCYVGAHGCDAFTNRCSFACNYIDIIKFLSRYPHNQICCILNTSRYTEQGQHWTAAGFTFYDSFNMLFACSLGSSKDELHENIIKDLHDADGRLVITYTYQPVALQTDNYNCGVYSVLFVNSMFMYPRDAAQCTAIGQDAKSVNSRGIDYIRTCIIGNMNRVPK